jgi:hypothetical protein
MSLHRASQGFLRSTASAGDAAASVEALEARRLFDVTLGGNGALLVTGTSRDDVITLSLNAPALNRLSVDVNGSARSFALSGVRSIRVEGGSGDDDIELDQGNGQIRVPATLIGGSGDDTLFGGAGNDNLQGQAGDDRVRGQAGNDSLSGGTGDDDLGGGNGNDRLEGHDGHDELEGDAGNDTLSGSAGVDDLDGGDGTDTLNGGSGSDELEGGDGFDAITGGDGGDSFLFEEDREIRDKGAGGTDAQEVTLDQLPAAVRATVLRLTEEDALEGLAREFKGSVVDFEVEYVEGGVKHSIRVLPDGRVTEEEVEIDQKQLPFAVLRAVRNRFPGGEITEAEFRTVGREITYEVEVESDDRAFEAVVTRSGRILEVEEQEPEPEEDEPELFRDFATTGENRFFILKTGYRLVLRGTSDGEQKQLVVTVLDALKMIDGVETRIIEERETENGELVEVSRNYVAIDEVTGNVYYFGEDVDFYEDGRIVDHGGAWRSGEDGATFGVLMPGTLRVGMTFLQENAPGVALDEAEVLSIGGTERTPAGTFNGVLRIEESTPLEPGVKDIKVHAPGVGLIRDEDLVLVSRSGG